MLKTFKTFYGFLLKYKKEFIAFVLILIFGSALGNITPYIYKRFIDSIPQQDYQLLVKLIILYVAVRIIAHLIRIFAYYIGDKSLFPATRDARVAVFRKIQDLDFAFHANKSVGSLISIFKRGDGAFFTLFYAINHDILRTVTGLAVILFFYNTIDPFISLLMFAVFVGNAFIGWQLIKNNIAKRRIFNKAEDKISGIIADNMINYETVKFFAQEKKEISRLKLRYKDWVKKLWNFANSFRLIDIVIGTLSNLGMLAIYWIVINKFSMGLITIGDIVMVFTFSTVFYWAFFDLIFRVRDIAKNYIDIEKYLSILDNETLIKDPIRPEKVEGIRGGIEFENVHFDYPDGKKNVLVDFNLEIKPGESIGFVGRSGVGKTTIIRLLLRFYDTTKGRVLLDGIDIRDMTKAQLRSFIGIVPQEPILFNNTIGFNIKYGNPKASKKQIEEAVKMAHLDRFIKSLELGYKTMVGERGIKLSGGQKQRLAIARMILANPKIIIFDEATSNLDSESEKLIQDSLWKIAQDRTVLIIAHRFSTVRPADRIIVLDEGKIVESGKHHELMKKKGLYSYLWELQAKEEEELLEQEILI